MSKVKILVGSSYTSKTILESSVKKEGDRAVDQIQFAIPKNEFIATNDKVYYVQDFATLDDLSLILNFLSIMLNNISSVVSGLEDNLIFKIFSNV